MHILLIIVLIAIFWVAFGAKTLANFIIRASVLLVMVVVVGLGLTWALGGFERKRDVVADIQLCLSASEQGAGYNQRAYDDCRAQQR